jgi:hypothetical protein
VLHVLVLREMYNDSMMFVQSKYKLMIQPHIEATFVQLQYIICNIVNGMVMASQSRIRKFAWACRLCYPYLFSAVMQLCTDPYPYSYTYIGMHNTIPT